MKLLGRVIPKMEGYEGLLKMEAPYLRDREFREIMAYKKQKGGESSSVLVGSEK